MVSISEVSHFTGALRSFAPLVVQPKSLSAESDSELDWRDRASTCASLTGSNASTLGSDCETSDDEEVLSDAMEGVGAVPAFPHRTRPGRSAVVTAVDAVIDVAVEVPEDVKKGSLRRVSRC